MLKQVCACRLVYSVKRFLAHTHATMSPQLPGKSRSLPMDAVQSFLPETQEDREVILQ